jgi:hypothetical protein
MPNGEWATGMLGVTQGTSLLGGGDKDSVMLTGGSSFEPADRDLCVVVGVQDSACSWSLVMPNGTADRTQRGGAVGGGEGWKWLYDGGMKAR